MTGYNGKRPKEADFCPHCGRPADPIQAVNIQKTMRLDFWVTCLTEVFGWYMRAVLTGLSLKRKGSDWLLIVRWDKGDGHYVDFIQKPTIVECFTTLGVCIAKGWLTGSPDRFWKPD